MQTILSKKKFFLFIPMFIFIIILYLLFSYGEKKSEIKIIATKKQNENAKGNEVWLTALFADNAKCNISNYVTHNTGWIIRDEQYLSIFEKDNSLILQFKKKEKIELEFLSHEWSGIVEIQSASAIKHFDLYKITSSSIKTLVNSSYYFIIILKCIFTMAIIINILILLYSFKFFNYILNHPVVSLIGIGILTRLYYLSSFLPYTLFNDSEGYINYNFGLGRTPIYPLLIRLLKLIFGENAFLYATVCVQSIIALISIYCMYKTLLLILLHKKTAYGGALLYAVLPGLVNYEFCILTDSLSISGLVILIYFLSSYLSSPNKKYAILINITALVLLFLRPSNVLLGIILLFFWSIRLLIRLKDKRSNLIGLCGILVYFSVYFIYSAIMYLREGYFSISSTGILNQLITLIMQDLYFNSQYIEYQNIITNAKATSENNSWIAFGSLCDFIIADKERWSLLSEYIKSCIHLNLNDYINYLLKTFKGALSLPLASIYAETKNDVAMIINAFIFPFTFGFSIIIIASELIYSLHFWIKNKIIPWVSLGLSTFAIGYLIIGIFGAPIEIARHSICVIPLFIIIMLLILERIYDSTKVISQSNRTLEVNRKEI